MSGMTPCSWWTEFERGYSSLESHHIKLLQRLSEGTEKFRPDEWRRDPFFVKIWLAYLEAL